MENRLYSIGEVVTYKKAKYRIIGRNDVAILLQRVTTRKTGWVNFVD